MRGKIRTTLAPATLGMVTALMISTAMPALAQTAPAPNQPQNFFEALFPQLIEDRLRRQKLEEPVVVEKVSAPRYFRYKAEKLVPIDLASLSPAKPSSSPTVAAEPAAFEAEDGAAIVEEIDPTISGSLDADLTPFDMIAGSFPDIVVMAEPSIAKVILDHYETTRELVWLTDELEPNARARSVLALFDDAAGYGLDRNDYAVSLPADTSFGEAARFEIAMMARAIRYGRDAKIGRVNPNKLSGYHDFPRTENIEAKVLAELTGGALPAPTLRAMHPDNAPFKALMAELDGIDQAKDGLIVIPSDILIKPGDRHEQVPNILAAMAKRGSPELQARIAALNGEAEEQSVLDNPGQATLETVDDAPADESAATTSEATPIDRSEYSKEIADIVKAFQTENDLAADGVVGPNTVSKLTDVDPETKRQRTLLAMERLRWHPHELGETHVFVNQPAFRARFVEKGKSKLDMRVVVGKRANQTSFFHDVIETVEYNPYWGIPRSILVNEYLPKLRANPAYLDERGYEVTDRRGRRVSSATVDWNQVGSRPAFDVRQRPGPRNALGELKILFPNKHAIYMHDTPARKLFDRSHRAYSHGCIRLHKPREMAAAVLGKSVDYIAERVGQGHASEEVQRQIPVYVAYFTAWPKDDGEVEYFADTYGRDDRLNTAIEATRGAREAAS